MLPRDFGFEVAGDRLTAASNSKAARARASSPAGLDRARAHLDSTDCCAAGHRIDLEHNREAEENLYGPS